MPRTNLRPVTTSSDGRRQIRPRCSICGKRIRHDKPETKTAAGDPAHVSCVDPAAAPRPPRARRPAKAKVETCGMCSRPINATKVVRDEHGPVHWTCLPKGKGGTPPQPRRPEPASRPPRPAAPTPPGVQDAPPVISAARAGRCPWCEKPYPVKAKLTKTPMGWVHVECSPMLLASAEFQRNKGAVESGDTFRSQAPSTWRRKSSPSRNA